MKKISAIFSGFFGFVIVIYFISVSVMGVYYTYRDIKVHDSFVRYLFISPIVGVFKATHWPYYELIKQTSAPDVVEYEGSVKAFFISQKLFDAGNKAVQKRSSGSNKAAYECIKSARESALRCNADELNAIYNDWGTIVRDKFVPALDVMLKIFDDKLKIDPQELARGEILLQEYFDWTEANNAELINAVSRHINSNGH